MSIYPTYTREPLDSYKKQLVCQLCGLHAEMTIIERKSSVKLNFWIPWGKYHEYILQCPKCKMEYLIDETFSKALIPSKPAKIMLWVGWGLVIVPMLNIIMHIIVMKMLPVTSNNSRQWAKIALIPAVLITGLITVAVIMGAISN